MLAFLKSAFTPLVLMVDGMIEMEDDKNRLVMMVEKEIWL